MRKSTFIIATYQDKKTLKDTIVNLMSTVSEDEVKIIVVSDGDFTLTKNDLSEFSNVTLYHNPTRLGVGYSLDFGVKMAQTEIVFPMGCDIRFSGDWYPRFFDVVSRNPKSIICTKTAGLNTERLYITGKEGHYYGSKVLFNVNPSNNGKEPLPFRAYLEAKWNKPMPAGDVEQIGCVLGAFYGCYKSWFQEIGGFQEHRIWGTLEPLISIRSYLHGGNCLIDCKTVTGHIFKSAASEKKVKDLLYNKLLVAYTLLPRDMEEVVYEWAKTIVINGNHAGLAAIDIAKENIVQLNQLRKLKDSLTDDQIKELIEASGVMDDFKTTI